MAVAKDGRIHFASHPHRVMAFDTEGVARVIAGTGQRGFSGDGGPATAAQLSLPGPSAFDDPLGAGIAFDLEGRLLIADYGNGRVRRVDPDGTIRTLFRLGEHPTGPETIAVAADGTLYLGYGALWRVPPGGTPFIVNVEGFYVSGVAVDSAGNVYMGDRAVCRIRRLAADGTVSCIEPTTLNSGSAPPSLAFDPQGGLLYADPYANCVRRIAPGTTTPVPFAGQCGTYGFGGDGGPALAARLAVPNGIATDPQGNVYIADTSNFRIRKVDPNGIITTIGGDLRPK